MAKDKMFFIISFALLALIAAYLFSHKAPIDIPMAIPAPAPELEVKKQEEVVEVKKQGVMTLIAEADKIAVPFQLYNRTAIVQFMNPGNYVDVIFTSKQDLGLETISLILLPNIRILSIGKDADGKSFGDENHFYKPNTYVEILLEMTPKQAEILSFADIYGTVNLEIVPKGQSIEPNPLVDELLKSNTEESFKSILVTNMIHSLFPHVQLKIIATAKGYIATGKVDSEQTVEKIIKVLDMLSSEGDKAVVSLLEVKEQAAAKPKEKETVESKLVGLLADKTKRIVAVELSTRDPIFQLLAPGVSVDIKFTSKSEIGISPLTLILLKNVRILAVEKNSKKTPPVGSDNKPIASDNNQANALAEVFMEMSLQQADLFSYASASGIVSLELEGSYPMEKHKDLLAMLLESDSTENFQSILVTYMIQALFPEVCIDIIATPRGFIIEGTVPDPQMADKMIEIITKLVPGGDKAVINLLDIEPQQVMLAVKLYEVQRELLGRVGLNWQAIFQSGSQTFALGAFLPAVPPTDPNYFFSGNGISNSNFSLTALVDMLEEDAHANVLAEPRITTVSGKTAHFFSGGEFPILIPQGGALVGTVTVEYKKYGVLLECTPEVALNGLITLHVIPEISTLDKANAVVISGFVIPALIKRKVDTIVKLWPGQSYIIAGMYLDEFTDTNDHLYGLNKLPFIGALFGSTKYNTSDNELVIIVTPYLINDNDATRIAGSDERKMCDPSENEIVDLNAKEMQWNARRTERDHFDEAQWRNPGERNPYETANIDFNAKEMQWNARRTEWAHFNEAQSRNPNECNPSERNPSENIITDCNFQETQWEQCEANEALWDNTKETQWETDERSAYKGYSY